MEKTCKQLTTDILKSAVSTEHGVPADDVTIENIVITSGSKKGEGFICEIAAVHFVTSFNGQTLEKNYIAKYAPEGTKGVFVKEFQAFDQETRAYNFLIPKLQEVRTSMNLKPLAFARCFYASAENELIIMENLKIQNFQVVQKKPEPLTLNGVKLVLKELASFHATSHHFINTYPGGREALTEDYKKLYNADFFEVPKMPDSNDNVENTKEDKMKGFFRMISQMFSTAVKVTKQFGSEDLADRMSAYHQRIIGEMVKLFMMKWRLSFVVHGDAWYNNFLFRYSPESLSDPSDVVIVDLQGTKLGRPGIELAYFLCSSTSPEQRQDHLDHLLKYYYDTFFEELRKMGDESDPFFTFNDLTDEFDECYPFGFALGCAHSQVLLVSEDSEEEVEFEFIGKSEEESSKMMEALEVAVLAKVSSSPEYRKIIIGLVEEAAQRNII